MGKITVAVRFRCFLFPSVSHNFYSNPSKPFISFLTSLSNPHLKNYSSTAHLNPINSVLIDYLVNSLKFPKAKAIEISSRFRKAKSLEKPKAVIDFFRALGLSDAHIESIAHGQPQVLFMNVEKTLKPKVTYFQEVGLSHNHLSALLSRHTIIFNCSLNRSLEPCTRLITEILKNDGSNRSNEKVADDVFKIFTRSNRILGFKSRFESNVLYFKSCGIVGSQLSGMLLRQTRIFCSPTEKVMQVVSKAVEMGFAMHSRMLVYGVLTLSQITTENINKKYDVIQSFGFLRKEVTEMFLKVPRLLSLSDTRIRCGIKFFLHNLMIDKSMLVRSPVCLALSLEKRVIPRCRVMDVIKSRNLSKSETRGSNFLFMTNEKFVEVYISRFGDDAEDLMLAYEGRLLEFSKE